MIENTLESTSDIGGEGIVFLLRVALVLICLSLAPDLCRALHKVGAMIAAAFALLCTRFRRVDPDDAANITLLCTPDACSESCESEWAREPEPEAFPLCSDWEHCTTKSHLN